MIKTVRMGAEAHFAKSQSADKTVLKEKEKAQQTRLAKAARLRALRLAFEASETEKTEKATPEKAADK